MVKPSFKSTFGQRLRESIGRHYVSETDFARHTLIHDSNLSHYIAGDRKPGLDTIATILTALPGVDARWLITGVAAR